MLLSIAGPVGIFPQQEFRRHAIEGMDDCLYDLSTAVTEIESVILHSNKCVFEVDFALATVKCIVPWILIVQIAYSDREMYCLFRVLLFSTSFPDRTSKPSPRKISA